MNKSINSGDIYFVELPLDKKVWQEYQDRLTKEEIPELRLWKDRPGVVVSDESENSVPGGGVLVSFITRGAHSSSFYSFASPSQLDITLGGRPATVLSSRAFWVSKSDLGGWMGSVSESELRQIVSNVRRSGTMTPKGEALLYQPEGLEAGRQPA